MDLSGLSSNLPTTRPPTQTSIDELSSELTNEFKSAAKAVAALYNSTNTPQAAPSPLPKNAPVSAMDTPAAPASDAGAASPAAAARPAAPSAKLEFANAAKSVSALYRLTNNSLSLVRNTGYMDCLDDLVQVLTNGEDLENWVLAKRAEMLQQPSQAAAATAAPAAPAALAPPAAAPTDAAPADSAAAPFEIPLDYAFSMSSDATPHHHFRPSFPPLSVSHSAKSRSTLLKLKRERQLARKLSKHAAHLHSQSSEDMATSDDELDELDEAVAASQAPMKDEASKLLSNIKRRKLDLAKREF